MYIYRVFSILIISIVLGWACSSSSDDDIESQLPEKGLVSVNLDISFNMYIKSGQNNTMVVDRILILPFKKKNESLSDDLSNYEAVSSSAKQFDVSIFPSYATKLILEAEKSYQILILGYKQSDFDFLDQNNAENIFKVSDLSTPTTLDNFQVILQDAKQVPELFACIGDAYIDNVNQGQIFKPQNINKIQGNLVRRVSRITVDISKIPDYISSVSLEAEYLVTTFKPIDGESIIAQQTDNNGNNIISTQSDIPSSRTVSLRHYLLPTNETYKTRLYVNVLSGNSQTQYQIKVPDLSDVSESNYILFYPNNEIVITGDYAKLDSGMTINNTIGLDDDEWNDSVSQ